jgi:hypothetical protein
MEEKNLACRGKPRTRMIEPLWFSGNQVTPKFLRSSGSLRRLMWLVKLKIVAM